MVDGTIRLSRNISPAAATLDSSTHQREQQHPTFALQHPLPVPRAMVPADSEKAEASLRPALKATDPADIGKAETPKATSRPAKHFTILGRRHWVVHVRGDGNCFFCSVSKAVHHGNDKDHIAESRLPVND